MSKNDGGGSWNRPGYIPSSHVFKDVEKSTFVYAEHSVSDAEFTRRHKVIREFMERKGLDVLVVGGGSDVWNKGFSNMRWITNQLACQYSHYEYVVVPLQGDITLITVPMYVTDPGRRARCIVEDVRAEWTDFGGAVARRIKELGKESGTVGIVEISEEPGIPVNHWNQLQEGLPKARFETVTKDWWLEVRLVKSDEEVEFIERAAHIGDKILEAIAENVRPGMTERDLFAWIYYAMLRAGGEVPTLITAISFSMHENESTTVRETPQVRTLKKGDVILTELSPRYPDGSECQTGRTFIFGEPTDEYAQMIELMWKVQNAVVDTCRPGMTDEDVRKAAQPAIDAGYILPAPIIHSDLGGGIDAQPFIMAYHGLTLSQHRFTFQENMTLTPETYICAPDMLKGVYTLDTYVTTKGAPRILHKYPREVVIL